MKKSTRVLAFLLCVVMMASLMPSFALADEVGTTVVDNTGEGKDIFKLSADRYSVDVNPGFTDTGYGYETTYLLPKANKVTEFNITRTAKDYNRWWRWADDNTVYNQRKTNEEVGYVPEDHNTGITTTAANGEAENIEDWTAIVTTGFNEVVTKSGARSGHKYILSKPLLSPQPCCFQWKGGNTDRAATVEVSINRDKKLGTHCILWSANGTSEDQWFAYIKGQNKPTNGNGLKGDRYVHYGDLGQNFIYIVEPRTVTYKLDGGNITIDAENHPNDTNNQQYVVWTTGTAKTSQKHKVISNVPTKPGQIFNGWYCEELGKVVTPGQDLNNGITENMTLVAQWTPDVDDPDYKVHFDGNGETSGSMTDQGFKIDMPQNLTNNQFVQTYTISYNANGGKSERTSEPVNSQFRGWTKVSGQQSYIDYSDGQEVVNLTPERTEPIAVVNLYAQWTPGTVTLPNASREVTDSEASDSNIIDWMFDGWYYGDQFVGMAGDTYTIPGNGATLTAHWTAVKSGQFYIYHSATGKTEAIDIGDYAAVTAYKKAVEDSEGDTHASDVQYVTSYDGKKTFDLTSCVTEGYLYGGTFSNEKDADEVTGNTPTTANINGEKWVVTTEKKWISLKLVDVVKTAEESSVSADSATAIHPRLGETYYIHEVSDEHLRPSTFCVWANAEEGDLSGYCVTNVYLITAIDREYYDQAGFTVDGNALTVRDNGRYLYNNIQVKQGAATIPFTYFRLNPLSPTTEGSYMYCCEITGLEKGKTYTVRPYWRTLDGVTITGAERTFTYRGFGTDDSYKQLDISTVEMVMNTKASAPRYNAPLMTMSTFNVAQSAPVEIPTQEIITVVDGENSYTVQAQDNSIVIQPAGADGKYFAGWYTDEAYTEIADLNNVNDGDTVYAKYISDSYLQVKYSFNLLTKKLSLTSALDSKDYADTGYIITTKNGDSAISVSDYASKFALKNANQLFGVEKNAPLMNADYKLSGLKKNDTVTVTPYLITADGTVVYGTARTLTYTGLTMKG